MLELPRSGFGVRNKGKKAGFSISYCKKCFLPALTENRLRRQYGITTKEYQDIWEIQGGLCAVCKRPESENNGKKLAVDHNHTTGNIRGLLCLACNTAIGSLKDSKELVKKAFEYLDWYEKTIPTEEAFLSALQAAQDRVGNKIQE